MESKTLPLERHYDPYNQKPVEYYDKKAAKDVDERKTTETYNHRVFNNWIKSALISKYAKEVKDRYKAEWGSDDESADGRPNELE